MCRPIVLCVYGMINDTKRWHDGENHPTRRGLIQGRHVNESIQESPECIFDPSRYAYMRGYYGLLMEDAICSVSDGRFGEWEVPCEL